MFKLFNNFDECLVSSQRMKSEFFKVSTARNVISSKFPIGVETIYKFLELICIMKIKIISTLFFLLILNSNLFADENNKSIKIGLLAPLTGKYSELGDSLLYSLQLALEEINDDNVIIIPRDSGFNDKAHVDLPPSQHAEGLPLWYLWYTYGIPYPVQYQKLAVPSDLVPRFIYRRRLGITMEY